MISKYSKSFFEKKVRATYPGVTGFHVDCMAENVEPVEYDDFKGNKRREWPPVARWKVGSKRFSYVLRPTFNHERWSTFLFSGTSVVVDYSSEEGRLLELIRLSSDGKTAEEMNKLIGNSRADRQA